MKIEDVIILVGGKGSRLGNISKITPKPLIKIDKITFLKQIIIKLLKYKFKNIYLICSYKKKRFFNAFDKKKIHNTKIYCIDEGVPKGTAGGLYKLKKKLKKNFILLNGDTFFEINFTDLIEKKLNKKSIFMCLTKKTNTVNNYKINNINVKNEVVFFSKKSNFVNGGIYLLNKNILKKINNKYLSFENDILKTEIKKNKVIGKYFNNFFIDIGSKKKLNFLKKNPKILKNKCFFLDRDVVINKDVSYINNFRNSIFLKDIYKAIRFLNNRSFLVIIITNQVTSSKGITTKKQMESINESIKDNLYLKNKSVIDDIFYSSNFKYLKQKNYKRNKFYRKSNFDMILKATKKWNIDLSSSFFIGNKILDYKEAKRHKLKFYFKKKIPLYNQLKNVII